jgi:Skp family chaperone for outer membrane proteins
VKHRLRPLGAPILVVFLVLCGFNATGPIEPAHAGDPPVIAILDMDRILRTSKASIGLREEIDKQRTVHQGELRKQEEALRAADQELARQRAILSVEAFAAKRKGLQDQVGNLQRDFTSRQKELEQTFAKGMAKVRRALVEVAAEIATEQKIDIILLKATVVLVSRELDITKDALKRLDERLPSVIESATQN